MRGILLLSEAHFLSLPTHQGDRRVVSPLRGRYTNVRILHSSATRLILTYDTARSPVETQQLDLGLGIERIFRGKTGRLRSSIPTCSSLSYSTSGLVGGVVNVRARSLSRGAFQLGLLGATNCTVGRRNGNQVEQCIRFAEFRDTYNLDRLAR
jgi:hypothetical protein